MPSTGAEPRKARRCTYDVGRLKITTAILQLIPRGNVANGPFSSIKSVACKPPYTPDLGVFVQAQVAAQQDKPNPVSLSFLDGINGRVWLASDRHGAKLIGDDRHWRVNVAHVLKLGREKCPPTLWRRPRRCSRKPLLTRESPGFERLSQGFLLSRALRGGGVRQPSNACSLREFRPAGIKSRCGIVP